MNVIEVILLLGFVETVILFLYAIRSYLFAFASLRAKRVDNHERHDCNPHSCFVSVLLPIYNEPNVVDRLLKACTSFNSPPYEVLVIDDSDDGITTEKLKAWRTHPNVKVIHRDSRRGWKGGALNVGLDHADPRNTHALIFDADFVPPSDLITRFLARFKNDGVVAVQGYQRHDLNAEENWITKGVRVWHSLYNMVELNGLSRLGLSLPLTGSVYMVRTDVLRKLRFEEVITEDWDLTVRLYESGYRVLYDPTLVASGECPSTLRRVFRQQMRWAEGHTRTFRDHLLKILRSRFLSLRDKINFLFVGYFFLNSVLVFALMVGWFMTSLFPNYFLPTPFMQAGLFLLTISTPSAIAASIVALSNEGARKDVWKIPYTLILNYVMTPAIAYAALKGLLTNNSYFHRTYKTGKVTRKSLNLHA